MTAQQRGVLARAQLHELKFEERAVAERHRAFERRAHERAQRRLGVRSARKVDDFERRVGRFVEPLSRKVGVHAQP